MNDTSTWNAIEFSHVVQRRTDSEGGELAAEVIWQMFADEYLHADEPALRRVPCAPFLRRA